MSTAASLGLAFVASITAAISAQSTPPPAELPIQFEAASIRRNVSPSVSTSTRVDPGGRITIVNATLHNLISNVHNLPPFQVVGGPDWVRTERYDITAVAAVPPTRQQMELMMRALLEDRFSLKLRRETRDMPIFALVLARTAVTAGPRMKPTSIDCEAAAAARARGGSAPSCGFDVSGGSIKATGMQMRVLVQMLSQLTGRMVVDQTGLSGAYDIELTWTPEPPPGADRPATIGDGPSLFTALQEQLGLRLDAQRGPAEVLVIEQIERPTVD